MDSALFRSGALSMTLLSGHAAAIGFGDISLLSHIGEPLRAEVAIVAGGQDAIDTACFSLAPLRDSDLPVVTSARLHLIRDGQNYRLSIAGNKPISDPVFLLAVRASCGVELQRDFVLMPLPPIATAEAAPVPVVLAANAETAAVKRAPARGKTWPAGPDDTLESIAEALVPDDLVRQRRMLDALKRANPELDSSLPLAEGTVVRIPKLHRPAESSAAKEAQRPPRSATAATAQLEKPAAKPASQASAKAPAAAGGGARLVLGAPPADLKAGETATPLRAASLPEMEERMAKMEDTIHLLNEQIAKLNQALTLTGEALAAQQKLQAAQAAMQTDAPSPAKASLTAPAALPAPLPTASNWIELLLSAAGGGIIAALAAHFIALRRRGAVDEQIPLALQATRGHPPSTTIQNDVPIAKAQPSQAGQSANSELSSYLPDSGEEEVPITESDGNAILKIADIMLSFGHVHGAVETLAQYIEEKSPDQVQPWTTLLQMYRRGNMRPEYDQLAERIRNRFNIHVPSWEASPTPARQPGRLEDYDHVVGHLIKTWGRQECLDYLQTLVKDNRDGQRNGFPLEVVDEMVLLMRVLKDGYDLPKS